MADTEQKDEVGKRGRGRGEPARACACQKALVYDVMPNSGPPHRHVARALSNGS